MIHLIKIAGDKPAVSVNISPLSSHGQVQYLSYTR